MKCRILSLKKFLEKQWRLDICKLYLVSLSASAHAWPWRHVSVDCSVCCLLSERSDLIGFKDVVAVLRIEVRISLGENTKTKINYALLNLAKIPGGKGNSSMTVSK